MMARRRSKNLSERQKKILEVLERFQTKLGYPPSIRDICEETGISSTSVVNYYLDQLQEMGYIKRDERISRGIHLLKPLSEVVGAAQSVRQAVQDMLRIPIQGRIIAGLPIPVPSSDFNYFDAETSVEIASSMLPGRDKGSSDLFALEVQGDSMIDAMVNEGDIVIMKPAVDAHNGEMVAVWLEDKEETTLKYFYRENDGRVRLQPANPNLKPIYIQDPTSLRIQGKVVMVIRQVGLAM